MDAQEEKPGGQRVFAARLLIGLGQGIVLYLLYFAHDHKAWPTTDPRLFAPLALVFLYVPLLVLQGIGNLRKRTLLSWMVVAVAVAAGFAFYDVWHAWPTEMQWTGGQSVTVPHVLPSPEVVVFTAVFLFVAHALISCIEQDRRLLPAYPTLFDVAWKLGVQLAIAACFVAAFWILLGLGVALFMMIKLHFFRDFINHSWFAIPATALATAIAIHITDTRANLVRGVRTLALMLLGWLLPVIALIAFAFLISLVFTGLEPLWQTRSATALLLAATAVLVIHINAAYQDGDPEHRPHHVLRVAGTLASILLIFIVTIAAYALWLRVDQYGWTVDRIDTAAVTLLALCFAVGYFIAALLPSPWLKLIETWNYLTTILGLAVLFALFTPIADPLRISVASQVERLQSGAIKPDKFDFYYLRWHGGRFGQQALAELAKSPDDYVRKSVALALKEWNPSNPPARPLTRKSIRDLVRVYPHGKVLPDSFVYEDWSKVFGDAETPNCLHNAEGPDNHCVVLFADLDGDGSDEAVIFLPSDIVDEQWWNAELLKFDGQHWRRIGDIGSQQHCKGDYAALLAGKFKSAPASDVPPDLIVNGHRVFTNRAFSKPDCG